MARRLFVRSLSNRRSRRLRGPIFSNFRMWQKSVQQQICLGRAINAYIAPVPEFLNKPLGKNNILHLLRVAEVHKHPDVSLLWKLLPETSWVDAACFLIQWGLHNTHSFDYILKHLNLKNPHVREKIVFTATRFNNKALLNLLNPNIKEIQAEHMSKNCALEAALQNNIALHSLILSWGVTSISNVSSLLLFLLHAPDRKAQYFFDWYDQLPPSVQKNTLQEFHATYRFVATPYHPKEFIMEHTTNPVLDRVGTYLLSKWVTDDGIQCPFVDQLRVFYTQPHPDNSIVIRHLSASTGSVFVRLISQCIDVKKHFVWALNVEDFDLASLLLPFLPEGFTHRTSLRPSETIYPLLHQKLQHWALTAACMSTRKIHINEQVRKI